MIAQPTLQDSLQIDFDSDRVFFALLEEGEHLPKLLDTVQQNADEYEPPVLYIMASRVFLQGEKKAALFWYYLAQVRSLYAKNLAQPSLHAFGEKKIGLYGEFFGTAIEAYALSNIAELQEVMKELKEYLSLHKENYNLLWLYTHRKRISNPTDYNFEPRSEWGDIRKQTIDKYFRNVQRLIEG